MDFCGTHSKGTPHGTIDMHPVQETTSKKEVWVQEIKGIYYYIDADNNVYCQEDVLANLINPKIIAKYVKTGNTYSIPAFGL